MSTRAENSADANSTPDNSPALAYPVTKSPHDIAANHLLDLERAVHARALHVRYEPGDKGAPPRLTVINPEADQLKEVIFAAPVRNGTDEDWYFWWSWADRITGVEQTDEAAQKIAHVLRHAGKTA